MAFCKSCGAEIVWVKTNKGKAMPCDSKKVMAAKDDKGSVEHLLNFAHAKNGEVYIYNEDGNEERLASYVAALCTSKLSADDILNGDCFECDFACAAGVLNFCAIQAAELREKLIRQEKERLAAQEAYGKRVAHDIFERLIERTEAVNASDYDGLGIEDLKLMAKEYGVEIEEKKQDD